MILIMPTATRRSTVVSDATIGASIGKVGSICIQCLIFLNKYLSFVSFVLYFNVLEKKKAQG